MHLNLSYLYSVLLPAPLIHEFAGFLIYCTVSHSALILTNKQTNFAENICQWWFHTYFSSVTQSCLTLCDPMDSSTPGFPVHHQLLSKLKLLKLNSIKSVMPSTHLVLCHLLLLLPSILPSIRVFSNESVLYIRWPKYWSFSFSISHSNEYSGLTSFRVDWLDLLVVQGTLKNLIQFHSSKASIIGCSAFFTVQLSIHTWLLEKP